MNMDTIVDTYLASLRDSHEETYELAAVATEDFGDCCVAVNAAMPSDVFVDMFASLYWMHVASDGLSSGEAARLADDILLEAALYLYGEEEAAAAMTPVESFEELSQEFFEDLHLYLGENIQALTGIVWNDQSGAQLSCSIRNDGDIEEDSLADILAAEVITMVMRGAVTPEEGRRALTHAREELEGWISQRADQEET